MARPNDVGPLALWLMVVSLVLLGAALWLLFIDPTLSRLVADARYEAGHEAIDMTMIADEVRLYEAD